MYRVIGGDKQEYGPASFDEIRLWIDDGRLSYDSLVCEQSTNNWRRLADFPEFSEALREQSRRFNKPVQPLPEEPPARAELNVADCLSRGWQLWAENFVLFCFCSLAVWSISMALQFLLPLGFAYWFIRGVLYGGLSMVFLRRLRGQDVSANEVFSGFGPGFLQLALVGMTTSLLTWLGFLFCAVPGIYFGILWIFSIVVVAERKVDFWPGMEISRRAVGAQWSKVFVLTLIAFLLAILVAFYAELKVSLALYEALKGHMPASGQIDWKILFEQMNKATVELAGKFMPVIFAAKVVFLANLPFGLSALICAYEDVLGPSSKRRD